MHSFWNDVQHPDHCSCCNRVQRAHPTQRCSGCMEHPRNSRPPQVLGQPMHLFQSALEIALKLRHVDIADELLHHGCWISPGTVLSSHPPYLSSMLINRWKDAVVAALDGCNEQSGWDTRSFEVLFKHDWDINECLGRIGDLLPLNIMA